MRNDMQNDARAASPRFLWILASVPLLTGAGDVGQRKQALSDVVPACQSGEYLTIKSGELRCISPLRRAIGALPGCDGNLLVRYAGDPAGELRCPPKLFVPVAGVAQLQARHDADAAKIAEIDKAPPLPASVFVGVTKFTTSGRITRPGSDPGLSAAAGRCGDEYPGSHMCTQYEMAQSVVGGQLKPTSQIPPSWIFFPAWKAPIAGALNPEQGMADSCASYTYGADDTGFSGMAVAWPRFGTNSYDSLTFRGGSLARCSQVLPIACCR
jgi:hypothetical protein